ncbi:T9SS type A sorting domain-containing protein, partial [bacterium]|nr:T9SS type A sorting domain-containing protein [bacterium]
TVANALNPCNPFYLIWFPSKYRKIVFSYLPSLLDEIEDLYDASFSNYRTKELFWKPLVDSIRTYASSVGRNVYLTHNGSYYRPDSAVDYFVFNISKPPSYPAPSVSDSQKTHLDARRVLVNSYRWLLKNSIEYVGRELPMVAFLDFGHTGFPFYHLGGKDEPADERAAYLRTYMAEAYASGLRFAVPLTGNEGYYIWLDSLSDGTSVGDIVKPITDFINRYGPEIYRNIFISPDESLVTVNGFVPYNGDTIAPSYANESKVAIAYTYGADGVRAYLHIINHNWDTVSHMMLPQESISVTVPVRDSCCSVMIISPDFSDTVYPAFDYSDSVVALTVPRLDYYNVVILDLVDATEVSDRGLELPDRSSISVYPNPFNSSCVIVVPAGARVKIYDLRGSVACELPPPKGRKRQRMREKYIWSPSESIPSGVYVVRVMVGDGEVVEKKVVLIK